MKRHTPDSWRRLKCPLAICFVIAVATILPANAIIVGPYLPDADTLHLWHLNEQTVPAVDQGSEGIHLNALRNGATLGNVSYRGFGTALSTYDGGPDATTDVGRDAYLSVHPLVNGPSDNVTMTYAGPSGAFTFEALVRIDFDPQTNFGTNSPGNGRGTFMQIINLDADENTNRVCQFRLVPVGLLNGNKQPLLEFINLNKDHSPQSLTAPIPTTGPDAIAQSGWYHVAVTYDGVPNQPDNLSLYWTLLDPSRTEANLIGAGQMLKSLPTGCSPDFALGQTGRQSPVTPFPNNNFVGLIDEVRMSGIARSSRQMMFGGQTVIASAPPTRMAASQPVVSKASSPEVPVNSEGSDHTTWMILSALVVIAGLLLWLVLALRKIIFSSLLSRGSVVAQANELTPQVQPARRIAWAAPAPAPMEVPTAQLLPTAAPAYAPVGRPASAAPANSPVQAASEDDEVGFRGVLRKIGLQDLIQMECLNRTSSVLEITNQATRGKIYLERGEIIHAVVDNLSGEKALNKLLSLRGGEFTLKPFERPEQRSIRGPWIQLLMEAARKRDEKDGCEPEANELVFTPAEGGPEDLLGMAALLADHPHVKEVLVSSKSGEALYNSKCSDPEARAEVCASLSKASQTVCQLLPVGEFKQLEIVNEQSRTIIQEDQSCYLLVGILRDGNNQAL